MTGQKHLAILINNSQKCATELTGKTRAFSHGLWPQRKCCRLIKTRVYTTKCRISNMEQVVPKLCTRNLNIQQITWRTQDYLFAGKLKIDKLKIKYCSMLAARGSRRGSRLAARLAARGSTLYHLQVHKNNKNISHGSSAIELVT